MTARFHAAALAAVLAGTMASRAQPQADSTLPARALDEAPHTEISNGLLSARIFPPGERELYKGTRFDHAGIVLHVTYKGHDFSDYWFDRFTPDPADIARYPEGTQHACCAVSGPVEEFAPVGFDEAAPGGRFLKPGIGILARTGDTYRPFAPAPILNPGRRAFSSDAASARFEQQLDDKLSGYGYRYEKTITLTPGKPQMTITHMLKNTGIKPIVTTAYDHNFLTFGNGNDGVEITAPFPIRTATPLNAALAKADGNAIRFLAPVPAGTTVESRITGFGDSAGNYDFTISDSRTGLGQRIRGDRPLESLNFWSVNRALGWEPYVAISLQPGQTMRWRYRYDFFATDTHH